MFCEVCGNEIEQGRKTCLFCGSTQQGTNGNNGSAPKRFIHKTVNLEEGMPFVEQALSHLRTAIDEAQQLDIQMLTIIHGYGSSGRGGAIRIECRKLLDYLAARGDIRTAIEGEQFNKRHGVVRDLLRRFPDLQRHPNLNKNNRGVTLVVLV